MSICSSCGAENPAGFSFCGSCAALDEALANFEQEAAGVEVEEVRRQLAPLP